MAKKESDLTVWTDIIEKKIASTSGLQLEDIQNALSHITEEKDRGLYGCCNYYMAYYFIRNGRQDECLGYLNESIRCLIGSDREESVSRCYNLLGVVAHGQNNLLLAAEQYEKALFYAEKYENHFIKLVVVTNLADVYYRIGAYEKAFECYRIGMEEYEKSGNNTAIGMHNYMLILAGYGYCLAMAGKLEEADSVAKQLYAMEEEKHSDQFPRLNAYTFFALLCFKQADQDVAEDCLKIAVQEAVERKSATEDVDSFMNLFDLLIMMEQYAYLSKVLDFIEPLAASENNEGFLLQMLAYRLEYCGTGMRDEEYENSARVFFKIKERYENKEYGQILNMMEMRNRLFHIEEEQQLLERQNTRLLYQADHDELSGVHNRGCLNRYAEDAFEKALRQQKKLGVLFVDIDYFKQMNDAYGHNKGDECIQAVASSIQECVPGDFVARYGGDEFVVITMDQDEQTITGNAERIVQCVRDKGIENKNSQVADVLTVTVGAVCGVPDKQKKMWDFLAAADVALYWQKKEKKGCVRFRSVV